MNLKTCFFLPFLLLVLIVAAGCGTAPTPTKSVPTQPPLVITVIVTATAPPVTATPAEATITPMPTLPVTATLPTGATATSVAVRPTATPGTPRATATRRPPTAAPVTATPVPPPPKYAAPELIGPNFIREAGGRKDERHFPADVLTFEWRSVGALAAGECYQIRVDFQPGAGDTFLECDPNVTQIGQAQTVRFTLEKPGRGGPNYSALLPTPPGDTWVRWFVIIVRDDGVGTGAVDRTGVRHKTTPLSPKSSTFEFPLKGG